MRIYEIILSQIYAHIHIQYYRQSAGAYTHTANGKQTKNHCDKRMCMPDGIYASVYIETHTQKQINICTYSPSVQSVSHHFSNYIYIIPRFASVGVRPFRLAVVHQHRTIFIPFTTIDYYKQVLVICTYFFFESIGANIQAVVRNA